jgi:hypothetical protein
MHRFEGKDFGWHWPVFFVLIPDRICPDSPVVCNVYTCVTCNLVGAVQLWSALDRFMNLCPVMLARPWRLPVGRNIIGWLPSVTTGCLQSQICLVMLAVPDILPGSLWRQTSKMWNYFLLRFWNTVLFLIVCEATNCFFSFWISFTDLFEWITHQLFISLWLIIQCS